MEAVSVTGMSVKTPSNYIGGLVLVDKTECIGFLPNAFDEALKKYLGVEGKTIRDGLVREGVVIPDKEGRTTRPQRIKLEAGNSIKTRVVCIPKQLIFPDDDLEDDYDGDGFGDS